MKWSPVILTFLIIHACQTKQPSITAHAFRLKPGIEKITREKVIKAGLVATCVGRLTVYSIRFANQKESSTTGAITNKDKKK
jgi:predicted DNA-binding protein with PD1-like motif